MKLIRSVFNFDNYKGANTFGKELDCKLINKYSPDG